MESALPKTMCHRCKTYTHDEMRMYRLSPGQVLPRVCIKCGCDKNRPIPNLSTKP